MAAVNEQWVVRSSEKLQEGIKEVVRPILELWQFWQRYRNFSTGAVCFGLLGFQSRVLLNKWVLVGV